MSPGSWIVVGLGAFGLAINAVAYHRWRRREIACHADPETPEPVVLHVRGRVRLSAIRASVAALCGASVFVPIAEPWWIVGVIVAVLDIVSVSEWWTAWRIQRAADREREP